MNINFRLISVLAILSLAGCASLKFQPSPQRTGLAPLTPPLNPSVAMAVIVQDKRPLVETEKKPSTQFRYSGSLFAVEGNEKTVATDLSNLIVQCGGASKAYPARSVPPHGPALVFEMTHWYSRAPLKPDKTLILVTGEFGGSLSLYRDGKAVVSIEISAKGVPGMIDTTEFAWQDNENSKLIWNAMMNMANSAQQNGYSAVHRALLEHWHLLSN